MWSKSPRYFIGFSFTKNQVISTLFFLQHQWALISALFFIFSLPVSGMRSKPTPKKNRQDSVSTTSLPLPATRVSAWSLTRSLISSSRSSTDPWSTRPLMAVPYSTSPSSPIKEKVRTFAKTSNERKVVTLSTCVLDSYIWHEFHGVVKKVLVLLKKVYSTRLNRNKCLSLQGQLYNAEKIICCSLL